MKKYFKNPFTIFGILCTVAFLVIWFNNDYMKFKPRKCIVLGQSTIPGTYKYPGQFYLVLREERGIVFDVPVSAATYSQSKNDSTMTFNLRQMDIQQTFRENAIYFFGQIFLGVFGMAGLFAGFLCIQLKDF